MKLLAEIAGAWLLLGVVFAIGWARFFGRIPPD